MSTPLPMMCRSSPGSPRSFATSPTASPLSSVVFGNGAGSVRVDDATYLVALLSASTNGLSPTEFQWPEGGIEVRAPAKQEATAVGELLAVGLGHGVVGRVSPSHSG